MKEYIERLESVFSLQPQKENFSEVLKSIESSIPFKGTNLWILIFAIFIASLGLNVNSTAVIIGAMLISPLMGPIIGIGFSVGINHPGMLKLSLKNYAFAFVIGLVTSTVYFLISPLSDAHSEILARTSPNIYDVFIAFFGGAAGMLANGSKMKGNVIPGVAIATALMPPLCTAGYGIATGQFSYFFGALYLYIINTVYIAVSTFVVVKILNFPEYHFLKEEKMEKRSKNIMWGLVFITFVPSVYFGYVMIKKNAFEHEANLFITSEAIFPNNFLLDKNISYENKEIKLTYGGQKLEDSDLSKLQAKAAEYGLDKVKIIVKQGFNFVTATSSDQTKGILNEESSNINKENISKMIAIQDSLASENKLSAQVFKELKVQNPDISGLSVSTLTIQRDSTAQNARLIFVETDKALETKQQEAIKKWLRVRVNADSAKVIFRKRMAD